ncbi:DUF2142 domain-containing protein [Embleya hyalina]|uniref:DUF2142 domain-containing protein n=1 Tax=Embleya hyalina TaxID=516124 RepID=A0A401YIA6_9ACTN|nr:DUF2142 domain-containing protein [Embleya hyalina]GCD94298.1 hypothetical protein EHYA_01958 [Embleya hyalina]
MTAPEARTRTSRFHAPRWLRRWLTAFLGFFLLGAGWALATPYDGAPDELQHIIRASGVAYGEIAPELTVNGKFTGSNQSAAAGLWRENCWAFETGRSAACSKEPGGDNTVHPTPTRAGRYNPIYYAFIGLPIRFAPNWTGIEIARLISAAMVAAMLASAAYALTYWTRHRFMLAGLVVATTPITMHLSGSINPNALEIAAGTALFAALIPVCLEHTPGRRPPKAPLVLAAVSGSILVSVRAAGPLWALTIIGVLLVPNSRDLFMTLLKSVAARVTAIVLTVATISAVAWTVIMKAGEAGEDAGGAGISFKQAAAFEVVGRWGKYIDEMVGVMSWLDARPPVPAYTLWFMSFGMLVFTAFVMAPWVDRWRLFALIFVVFMFPTLSDAWNVETYGFISQGRYMLPVAVGIPLLAAFVISRDNLFGRAREITMTRFLLIVLLPLHFVFLWFTMIRWQQGAKQTPYRVRLNAFAGAWHPPLGSVLPILLALIGITVIGAYVWLASRLEKLPEIPENAVRAA